MRDSRGIDEILEREAEESAGGRHEDAIFEAVSGFTTTGAIIFPRLQDLPISVLYYRSQIEWLGGIGIVVLAVESGAR